jgi:hypothetical protein
VKKAVKKVKKRVKEEVKVKNLAKYAEPQFVDVSLSVEVSLRADRSFRFLLLRHVPLRRGWGGGQSRVMGDGVGGYGHFHLILTLSSPFFTSLHLLHHSSPYFTSHSTFLNLSSPFITSFFTTLFNNHTLTLSSPFFTSFFTFLHHSQTNTALG